MKKNAFTMLELVMVIVVLGILAALAMPRLDRDIKQEAADTVLSNIRYTQHLALLDNKQKFNKIKWQRAFWKIQFELCSGGNVFITVGTDMDYKKDISLNEAALDAANGKPMFWENTDSCKSGDDLSAASENIFIGKKYGVSKVTGSGGCKDIKHIGFDHFGRPHISFSGSKKPDYKSYMSTACIFTFDMKNNESFKISIQPETGYAQIVGQEDS